MIYCIGDSFTAGDELPDHPISFDSTMKPYPVSKYSYPSILERKLGVPVINLGRGGCGNTRIVKKTMEIVYEKSDLDIVIIAWTNPLRIEMVDEYSPFDIWPDRNISRMSHEETRSILVKWITAYSDYENTTRPWFFNNWLRQIILLQSFLTANNKKYLMLTSDPYCDREINNYHKYQNLIDKVDSKYFLGWPKYCMQDWTFQCPTGPGGHFLEEGHERVAEKIHEYIRHLGWVS